MISYFPSKYSNGIIGIWFFFLASFYLVSWNPGWSRTIMAVYFLRRAQASFFDIALDFSLLFCRKGQFSIPFFKEKSFCRWLLGMGDRPEEVSLLKIASSDIRVVTGFLKVNTSLWAVQQFFPNDLKRSKN